MTNICYRELPFGNTEPIICIFVLYGLSPSIYCVLWQRVLESITMKSAGVSRWGETSPQMSPDKWSSCSSYWLDDQWQRRFWTGAASPCFFKGCGTICWKIRYITKRAYQVSSITTASLLRMPFCFHPLDSHWSASDWSCKSPHSGLKLEDANGAMQYFNLPCRSAYNLLDSQMKMKVYSIDIYTYTWCKGSFILFCYFWQVWLVLLKLTELLLQTFYSIDSTVL